MYIYISTNQTQWYHTGWVNMSVIVYNHIFNVHNYVMLMAKIDEG